MVLRKFIKSVDLICNLSYFCISGAKNDLQSELLLQVTCTKSEHPIGRFPDLEEALGFFEVCISSKVIDFHS